MKKSSGTAVEVKGLKKSFGNVKVLEGIDFTVKQGSIFALLGPNGAGKTTTIRILSTLLEKDGGKALVNGFDVDKHSDKVRSSIGLTGQYAAVDEYLTGEENLIMIGRLYRLSKKDSSDRARELLKQFDLVEAGSRAVKTYSGGMRRRLDLAMSLIAVPPIIFLDEPTTGLDPRSRLTLWEIIKKLAKSGITIVLTTQYMDEADHLADRIVVIDGGKVIAEGSSDSLKSKIGSDRLELTISKKSNFDKAKKIIDGKSLQSDADRRTISVAAKGGASKVRIILEKLEAEKIDVETISLHRPTLDDVFLTLTGHAVTENDEKSASKKKGIK
jgi:ABC-2 type transport system ATP-binding protein